MPIPGLTRRAPGGGKTVALTFDDGPAAADTQLVDILDRNHVHATFFFTGAHAAARPDLVRMVAQRGQLIGDHTFDHDYPAQVPGGWTTSYLKSQVARTNSELTALTGRPVCWFRPPGGFLTHVAAAAAEKDLSVVLWSIDTEDWKQPARTTAAATAAIVDAATATQGQDHPIVLLHSGKASHEPDSVVSPYRGNTIAALPQIIAWYRDHGYRFVDLDGRS